MLYTNTSSSDHRAIVTDTDAFDKMFSYVVDLGFRALSMPVPLGSKFESGESWKAQGWCPSPGHCIAPNSTWTFATIDAAGKVGATTFPVFVAPHRRLQHDNAIAALSTEFVGAFRAIYGALLQHMRCRSST